jgi:hypothetical protein
MAFLRFPGSAELYMLLVCWKIFRRRAVVRRTNQKDSSLVGRIDL